MATSRGLPNMWGKACEEGRVTTLTRWKWVSSRRAKDAATPISLVCYRWEAALWSEHRLTRSMVETHTGGSTPRVSSGQSVAQIPELILCPLWMGITPRSTSQYHSGGLTRCNATEEILCWPIEAICLPACPRQPTGMSPEAFQGIWSTQCMWWKVREYPEEKKQCGTMSTTERGDLEKLKNSALKI